MLIDRDASCLLLIDVQDRLAPAMAERDAMEANAAVLLKAAARLGVPVLVSEQYPKGLGPTVPALAALAGPGAVAEKTAFSCLRDDGWRGRFNALGRGQAVICGIEAHVCVLQTALHLRAAGSEVFVVADAVASRATANRDLALARLRGAGVHVVSTEMAVFEWLGAAGTPEFKDVSALIK